MYRHMVRHVVKTGQFRDFVEAFKTVNKAYPTVGLPPYKLWLTAFGVINEVFAEAEYESLDAHVAAWDRARENQAFHTAFRAMLSHLTDGEQFDYPLEPVSLD